MCRIPTCGLVSIHTVLNRAKDTHRSIKKHINPSLWTLRGNGHCPIDSYKASWQKFIDDWRFLLLYYKRLSDAENFPSHAACFYMLLFSPPSLWPAFPGPPSRPFPILYSSSQRPVHFHPPSSIHPDLQVCRTVVHHPPPSTIRFKCALTTRGNPSFYDLPGLVSPCPNPSYLIHG